MQKRFFRFFSYFFFLLLFVFTRPGARIAHQKKVVSFAPSYPELMQTKTNIKQFFFMKKQSLREHCFAIMTDNRRKEIVGKDYEFIYRIFQHHPERWFYDNHLQGAKPKFVSERNVDHSYTVDSIYVHYPDGCKDSFSYNKCLKKMSVEEADKIYDEFFGNEA